MSDRAMYDTFYEVMSLRLFAVLPLDSVLPQLKS